jgi:hypothetical protein
MSPKRLLVLMLIASFPLACAGGPRTRPVEMGPVDTGPNTLTAARQYLQGRWSLESFDVYPPGRDPIRLSGSGTLLYDEFGNLSMEVRTDPETGAALTKAGIANDGGVISSEGRVVVDMTEKKLTFIVQGQPAVGAPAGPLALSRPRYWEVDGDNLTLTTKDDQGKPLSVGRWRKES